MSPLRFTKLAGTCLVATAFLLGLCPAVLADGCATCQTCASRPTCLSCLSCFSCKHKCPPCFVHCAEGAPRLKFKCGCPKPVCDPCSLEHYGYYQTCWRPWSFPEDWSHCPVPPPAVQMETAPTTPVMTPVEVKPMPSAPKNGLNLKK